VPQDEAVPLVDFGLAYVRDNWDELCALHKELGLGSKPRCHPDDEKYDLHINVANGFVRPIIKLRCP
jgi:hypothetical protein